MSSMPYRICTATRDDVDAILDMQKQSIRAIGRAYYTPNIIESAIRHIGTMDPEVIGEGSFYIAVTSEGHIIGSGGWSRRVPGYDRIGKPAMGSETAPIQPFFIRGVYVHPVWARRGIATAIMAQAEATAMAAGAPLLTLTATLTGVPLYRTLRYQVVQPKAVPLPDGRLFDAVEMRKTLPRPTARDRRDAA